MNSIAYREVYSLVRNRACDHTGLRTSKPKQGISHTHSNSRHSFHSKGGGTKAKVDWIKEKAEG